MLDRRRFLQSSSAALFAPGSVVGETNPAIAKAMAGVRAAIPVAEQDSSRPAYHFHPPAQWNNDPNGTIQYRGWYHMFYQHNPYGAGWGNMHWGHARSRDLVNWEHLPIALWPSKEKGEDHVFSGGAILRDDGRPVVFYTSIGAHRDPEQWMAVPKDEDLLVWEKYSANPVLTTNLHKYPVHEWRDPFPFRTGGKTYLVCGGNRDPRGGHGEVQLYLAKNSDLTQWEHRGSLFRDPDRSVWNIECPNFFPLDGKWVLLTSPHRACEYFVGDFDASVPLFTPRRWGVLDPGAAYASNIIFDDKGRCLLLLWSNTQTPESHGWCGAMAMPRVLRLGDDGHLKQTPAPEFEKLRGEGFSKANVVLDNASVDVGSAYEAMELAVTIEVSTARTVGVVVSGTDIGFEPATGYLTVGEKEKAFVGRDKSITLRVFLDHRIMEVYANGAAIVHLMDPEGPGVHVFTRGGAATFRDFQVWPLKSAHFAMEHYRT